MKYKPSFTHGNTTTYHKSLQNERTQLSNGISRDYIKVMNDSNGTRITWSRYLFPVFKDVFRTVNQLLLYICRAFHSASLRTGTAFFSDCVYFLYDMSNQNRNMYFLISNKYSYFKFADEIGEEKETLNLRYLRALSEAKVARPLDIPIIEDKENVFEKRRDIYHMQEKNKHDYFTFADQTYENKDVVNIQYLRHLQRSQPSCPLDLPIIHDKENEFKTRNDKSTAFGKRYAIYWENKEMIDISNNIKFKTRTKLIEYTANFMEKIAQDIHKENISPN